MNFDFNEWLQILTFGEHRPVQNVLSSTIQFCLLNDDLCMFGYVIGNQRFSFVGFFLSSRCRSHGVRKTHKISDNISFDSSMNLRFIEMIWWSISKWKLWLHFAHSTQNKNIRWSRSTILKIIFILKFLSRGKLNSLQTCAIIAFNLLLIIIIMVEIY